MENQMHLSKTVPNAPRTGLLHWANLLYLVIAILSLLIAIHPSNAPGGQLPEWLDPGLAMILAQVGLILIPALLFVLLARQPIRLEFKLRLLSAGSMWRCLLIGLLCYPLFSALTTLVQLILALLGRAPAANSSEMLTGDGSPWLMLLGITLIAPLFEELLFRGVLLSVYERRFGVHAIWLVGLLFAIFHFDLEQLPGALLVGLIAGWLVYRTRSFWSGILVHFGANLFSGVLVWLVTAFPAGAANEAQAAASQAGDLVAQMWISVLVWGGTGLLLMIPVFFLLRSVGRNNPALRWDAARPGLGSLWSYTALVIGAIVYFATQLVLPAVQ